MGRLNSEAKYQKNIRKALDIFLRDLESITTKYEKLLRSELNYIADSAIDAFYEDYDPNTYNRLGDLYNTYKITVKRNKYDIEYEIDFSPNYMKYHRGKKTYIYEAVFEEGWHGGDKAGAGHPEPGIPWYRNLGAINRAGDDYESYEPSGFWLRRAACSTSPYEVMSKKMDDYISEWEEQYLDDVDKCCNKLLNDIDFIIEHRIRR